MKLAFLLHDKLHSQWHLPLSLPSPRAGASKAGATRGRGIKSEGSCALYATLGFPSGGFDFAKATIQNIECLVQLGLSDRQRRCERQDVAHGDFEIQPALQRGI